MPTENKPKKTTVDDIIYPLQPKQAVYTKSPWQESLENQESQENENTLKTPITQNTQSQAAAYEPGTFYQDFFKKNYPKLTEADLEKLREKERRRTLFSGLGDVMNAFHQAYAKTRGVAPVAEDVSLTGKMRERYEKLKKEYDTNKAQYANAYMNAVNLDEMMARRKRQEDYNNRALSVREGELEARNRSLDINAYVAGLKQKVAEGKLEIEKANAEINRLYKEGQISKMERDAASNELKAQAAWLNAQANSWKAGGYTVNKEITDEHGRTAHSKETYTYKGSPQGNQGSGGDEDNTPPSRRKSDENDNVPPSRRK